MAASAKAAKARGGGTASVATLNNVLMQMRKNCNHPDLITSAFDGSEFLPDAKELVAQCGKMKLVDRILKKLKAGGHKVLIFSQVRGSEGGSERGVRAAPTALRRAFLRTPAQSLCGHSKPRIGVRADQTHVWHTPPHTLNTCPHFSSHPFFSPHGPLPPRPAPPPPQMTKVLDLLDHYLEQSGHKTCRIDGAVSWQDRQAAMKQFNTEPETFAFLLSTRAGGLGINLTAADTVIIYDSDWNPHNDMQVRRCGGLRVRSKSGFFGF